jgi:integrase
VTNPRSARGYNKLSALKAERLKEPGRHSDGRNLYLIVDPSGAKRWAFIYRWKQPGVKGAGRLREMGLGSFDKVSLQKAREKAAEALELLGDGKDPITVKRTVVIVPTFAELADQWIEERKSFVRSGKSIDRWKRALHTYAAKLGDLQVDQIGVDEVLAVLKPMWIAKAHSAKLLRGYVEKVLDVAKVRGFRSGENPARWKGHLEHLLVATPKLQRGHQRAVPYAAVPGIVARLQTMDSISAWALEFQILHALRPGNVYGARWSEFDLERRIWTIPGDAMKAGREHQLPLGDRALDILKKAALLRQPDSDLVFHGQKLGRPLSNMAFVMLLRRLGVDATAHGFRSCFRDWAGEETDYPRDLVEMQMAHAVGDETERAYRRMKALDRRRPLMADWEYFCIGRKKALPEPANDLIAAQGAVSQARTSSELQ